MPLPGHKVTICGIPELSQHCAIGVSHVLSIIDTMIRAARRPFSDRPADPLHDVVAEYLARGCTPPHRQVLDSGERAVSAGSRALPRRRLATGRRRHPDASTPGQEDAAPRSSGRHGWPNTRLVEFADVR
jgi:hypothetical protein